MSSSAGAALLMERLGLDEAELCRILDADPVEILSGALDHRPELGILLTMTGEAQERLADGVLFLARQLPADLVVLGHHGRASAEHRSRHPVARAVVAVADRARLALSDPTDFEEISGRGVR